MGLPKPGEMVAVVAHRYTDVNGRNVAEWTVQGVVEWVDGNGAWIKGAQKSRWIPLEEFEHKHGEGDGQTDAESE